MITTVPKLVGHLEAAELLNISEATLRFWRCKGKGPRHIKFGPSKQSGVAYYVEDIEVWLTERKFSSTTEHSQAARAAGQAVGRYRTMPNLPIAPPWLKSAPEQSVA